MEGGELVHLSKNQKKKRRQKLAKQYKAVAAEEGQAQIQPVSSEQHVPGSSPREAPAGQQVWLRRPSNKRAKQLHKAGVSAGFTAGAAVAEQKLSVSTQPRTDRPASKEQPRGGRACQSAEQGAAAVIAGAAGASPTGQLPDQQQPQLGQREDAEADCEAAAQPSPEMLGHRIDLSHAASLIQLELLARASAPPGAAAVAAGQACPANGAVAGPECSPAGSGCCVAPGAPASAPAGAGAAIGHPAGLNLGSAACLAAASTVTSTLTSTLTVPAPDIRMASRDAAACAVLLAQGQRRLGNHIIYSDSDAEEYAADGAVAGSGGTDSEGEDCGDACEDSEAGTACAAAGQGGGSGGPVRRGPQRARRVYVYGNYHRYYGYRLGQAFAEDPRLQCFERGWFANRRCMDVGCNEGVVTLAMATKFGCRSMMGVDIDEHLIRKACTHLRSERSQAAVRLMEVRRGGVAPAERSAARAAHAALAQTWFVHADFLDSEGEPASFDTITCLSVVKWVHLNRGDAGLEALLAKFWRLLAPGGCLLLEPQPWKSYKAAAAKMRKQPVSPSTYFHRLEELTLRPEDLPHLLVDRLGFRLARRLQVAPTDAAAGFDRPMYLFRKPTC